MTSPNFSEILTTTLRNRTGKLADNVTNNIPLLMRMKERGTNKPAPGGRTIVQELEYAENASFQWYAGYETVDISPSDVFTAAEFDWKQASVAITASGLEVEVQNAGPDATINLLTSRVKNGERTMMNQIDTAIYSDGTGSSSKEIGGLQLLVEDSPSSTVGGILRSSWTFWQNQTYDASSDGGAAAAASNIQDYMNQLCYELTRNRDMADLWVADNNYYGFYESSLQATLRVSNPKLADAGFNSLKYKGSDVVLAGGLNGNCPANHMYALNTNYIHFRPHSARNMVPLENVQSINQDATVKLIVFAGNMTLSNASLQGVLKS